MPARGAVQLSLRRDPLAAQLDPRARRALSSLVDRAAARDAADKIRAWMETKGRTYHSIAFVAYGPLIDVWSHGVRGTMAAEAVSLVKVPQRMDGLLQASVSRKICSIFGLNSKDQ